MRNILSYLSAAVILVVAGVGVVLNVAYAGHQWIMLHHEQQGRGQPSFDLCMPIESWDGHADHVGDYYSGPFDNNECLPPTPTQEPTNEPTIEPTATPTDAPQPTPTPSDEPGEPTPTPTDEGCDGECEPTEIPTPTPTDPPTPVETPELPKAGLVSQYELTDLGAPWMVFVNGYGTEVWAGHNGEDSWPATNWWQLWIGMETYLDFVAEPGWYRVVSYLPDTNPTDVYRMYDTENLDVLLITCRTYDPVSNTWAERLLVGLVKADA